MATVESIKARCVVSADGCWLWQGATNWDGYGHARHEGRLWLTHRLVWTLSKGPIPAATLDHLCRVRSCCNPDHLEPCEAVPNIMRGQGFGALNAAKTTCSKGHPFTPDNTYQETYGSRRCIQCRRDGRRLRRTATRGG